MIYYKIPEKYLDREDLNKAINELRIFGSILNGLSDLSLDSLDKEERSENVRQIGICVNMLQNFEGEINKLLDAYQILAERHEYVITWWDCDTINAVYEELSHRVLAWFPFMANDIVSANGVKPFQNDVHKPFFELMEKYDSDKMFNIAAETKDFSLNNVV